jgi:hypothetical protein
MCGHPCCGSAGWAEDWDYSRKLVSVGLAQAGAVGLGVMGENELKQDGGFLDFFTEINAIIKFASC